MFDQIDTDAQLVDAGLEASRDLRPYCGPPDGRRLGLRNRRPHERSRFMRKPLLGLAVAGIGVLGLAGPVFAEPQPVPGPPTHEHALTTPGNENVVQIGPRYCSNSHAERGARNFHLKVHSTFAGAAPVTQAGLDIDFVWCG
jgi:hypothetical protein